MTRTIRCAAALAVALLAFVGLAGVASAQTYTGATLTINKVDVAPDGSLTIVGDNFLPNAPVSVIVASTPTEVGPAQTDGTGHFTLTFRAPEEVGMHTVTASDGVNTITLTFEVVASGTAAAPVGSSGALPYTGNSSSIPMAQIGAGLLAAGAIVVLSVRKRNQNLAHAKVDA